MIKTYSYLETSHSKLHAFVMAFFARIEKETGPFREDLFEREFYDNLVIRHTGILRKALKKIYETIKDWDQKDKTNFCRAIIESNDIKRICDGEIKPWKDSDIPKEIREDVKKLFIKLYEDVLKGPFFQPIYGTRLEHYHKFKRHKDNDHEFCPACGIVEMKSYTDDLTDQYDHYLPKDVYPFSSVNFLNLVPICTDCNSFLTKGNNDVLSYSGEIFYPYNEKHKGIDINLEIKKDNLDDLSKIVWNIKYSCLDGKEKQIKSWVSIYNLRQRHYTHITGKVYKWYKFYNEYMNDEESIEDLPDYTRRKNSYLRKLKNRKVLEYKALGVLLDNISIKSDKEAKKYSRFN